MPPLAYTWNDILHFLAVVTGAVILTSAAFVLVVASFSSLLIKMTTKLNWVVCCLIGFAIAVGSCKVVLFPPSEPRKIESLWIVDLSEDPILAPGVKPRYSAGARYKSGEERTVKATWSSSGPGLAVGPTGHAHAKTPGTYTVTAQFGGKKATRTETVADTKVVSLHLEPQNVTVKVGSRVKYRVKAKWSDGRETDVSTVAAYTSSDESVATLVGGYRTHAVANKPGKVALTVSYLDKETEGVIHSTH